MAADAKTISADHIPVIDISMLISGSADSRSASSADGASPISVANALHAASESLGFIYVKGHGIPGDVIESARRLAYDFFRSPEEEKSQVLVTEHHRGWLRPGAAKMQDDAKPDLKESFIWGEQDVAGRSLTDHPLRGPNQWPGFVPELQPAAMAYFHHAHQVAFQLMKGFALGLELPEDFFLRSCSRPLSRASFVYYPTQPDESDVEQFGVAPHTDFGVLTVLCQDSTGGLQVQDVNGEWIQAPPIEDTLVVNVGDLLSRWTNGAYKSTPHRVINRSGRERLSLVLAFDPDPETMIDATDVCGSETPAAFDAISCGDYLSWRFARAFSYRQRNKTDKP